MIPRHLDLTDNIQDTCDILNSLLKQAKERGITVNVEVIVCNNNELDGTFVSNKTGYRTLAEIISPSRTEKTNSFFFLSNLISMRTLKQDPLAKDLF